MTTPTNDPAGPASEQANEPLPKVPFRHAVYMAAQSMRNRFGRNLITLAGVALGIAFLMSVLTGDAVRRGMKDVEAHRTAVQGMVARIATVGGRLRDRKFALVGPIEPSKLAPEAIGELAQREARVAWYWPGKTAEQKSVIARLARRLDPEEAARLTVAGSLAEAVADSYVVVAPVAWSEAGVKAEGLAKLAKSMKRPVVLDFSEQIGKPGKTALVKAGFDVAGPTKPDPELIAKQKREAEEEAARTVWLVAVSMLVSLIGIANSMLMSVFERFREIGTMKCLGAGNGFVVMIFLLEAAFQGFVGAGMGVVVGYLFSIIAGAVNFGWDVFTSVGILSVLEYAAFALLVGGVLGVLAAIMPARQAARMVPADALRTEI